MMIMKSTIAHPLGEFLAARFISAFFFQMDFSMPSVGLEPPTVGFGSHQQIIMDIGSNSKVGKI